MQVCLSPLVWREPSTRRRPLDRVPAARAPSRHRGAGTGRLPQRHCSRTCLSWQLLPVFSESWFPGCIRVHFCKTVISAVKSTQSSQEGRPRRKGQVGSMCGVLGVDPTGLCQGKRAGSGGKDQLACVELLFFTESLTLLKPVSEEALMAGSL